VAAAQPETEPQEPEPPPWPAECQERGPTLSHSAGKAVKAQQEPAEGQNMAEAEAEAEAARSAEEARSAKVAILCMEPAVEAAAGQSQPEPDYNRAKAAEPALPIP
jgi:adenosylmethionine-8-amino-7-oxononanoate aminotransferase